MKKLNRKPTHHTDGLPIRNCLIDYIGVYGAELFELIKDISYVKPIEEVQCNYIYPKSGKQCISLLNSSSLNNKTGRYDLHRDIEKQWEYGKEDSSWKCTIPVYRKDSYKGKSMKKCNKPAYHRTCVNGFETIRCPKHLDVYLGYQKGTNEAKG